MRSLKLCFVHNYEILRAIEWIMVITVFELWGPLQCYPGVLQNMFWVEMNSIKYYYPIVQHIPKDLGPNMPFWKSLSNIFIYGGVTPLSNTVHSLTANFSAILSHSEMAFSDYPRSTFLVFLCKIWVFHKKLPASTG